jgi:quercetin dioxygenase-like cupin family protein
MNLKENHASDASVSAKSIFKGEGNAISLQILKDQTLKEHLTKVPALLICVSGEVVFENELGEKTNLKPSDIFNIAANVKHWVVAKNDSQLLLLK